MKKDNDGIQSVVLESARGLRDAGIMDETTMRELEALCLPPVRYYKADEIKRIRLRCQVSQAAFATYLNVSKISVIKWESGEKKPCPAAVKLLNLVDRKGLESVA